MFGLEVISRNLGSAIGLKLTSKTVRVNGRKFISTRNCFDGVRSDARRIVYVYKHAVDGDTSKVVQAIEDSSQLISALKMHAPIIRLVDKQGLRYALTIKQRALLVICGDDIERTQGELSDIMELLRSKIFCGDLNYFGINSGAVIAGHELVQDVYAKVSVDDTFLRLSNFRGVKADTSPEKPIFMSYLSGSYHFRMSKSSAYRLQITSGEKVSDLKKNSYVSKLGEFVDACYRNKLGAAALIGSFGNGRYCVHTEKFYRDIEDISERFKKLCLDDAAQYVLGKELNPPNMPV